MRNVTIKDIAKYCNVSTATVSYVINNKENQSISEDTRNKILHAVNMLNYKHSLKHHLLIKVNKISKKYKSHVSGFELNNVCSP